MYRGINFILVRPDNKILMQFRDSGVRNPSRWCIPGGRIEDGETIKQAVVREIKEETGISVPPESVIPYLKHSYELCNEIVTNMFFLAYVKEVTVRDNEGRFSWLDIERIKTLNLACNERSLISKLEAALTRRV